MNDPLPSEQRMAYWLARVLREEREKRGLMRSEIAGLAKRDQSTIARVEYGRSLQPDIDRYVAAYAEAFEIDDGRKLWAEALKRWMRQGPPPALT
jgi:transcriptional regulator with XRE-family HTH domain